MLAEIDGAGQEITRDIANKVDTFGDLGVELLESLLGPLDTVDGLVLAYYFYNN